jgi:hypothetical protein
VDQRAVLRALIEQSSSKLRRAASGVPDELFGKRPGRSLNPIGFIYFHVLRSWDEDLNVLCRNLAPDDDTWHRAGLSDGLDYEPLGRGDGGRGVGVGFSDAEVDAVPKRFDVLSRYHDLLDEDTGAYFDAVMDEELHRERESGPAHGHLGAYTPARLWSMVILHHAEHSGDIKFVKGMLGMPDATYPGVGKR